MRTIHVRYHMGYCVRAVTCAFIDTMQVCEDLKKSLANQYYQKTKAEKMKGFQEQGTYQEQVERLSGFGFVLFFRTFLT